MRTDKYGQLIFNEDDLCDLYMREPTRQIKSALVEDPIIFENGLFDGDVPSIELYQDKALTIDQFDSWNQQQWKMPKKYLDMDIAKWVLDQCKSEVELQRAGEELLKFQDRDMLDLLRYLKYLVDIMRENNIIWGVGRGSSVSSFVLFLIGVHKVDPLYYDLSIDEFLK